MAQGEENNKLDSDLNEPLTRRIEELEKIIERGLKSFIEVGLALAEIRGAKLYLQLGYSSFKLYCEQRWGMVRRNADRLINSAEIANNIAMTNQIENHGSLLSEKSLVLPTHERHIRPLFKFNKEANAKELQQLAWQRAIFTAPKGKITEKHVKKVVQEMLEDINTKDTPIVDNEKVSLTIGDICIIQAGDLTALKPYQGFWCVIKAKSDRVFDIDVFDRTLTMVKPEYLLKLECTEEQRDAGILLMSRLQRIASVETISRSINAILLEFASRSDFLLPVIDKEILYFIENRLGIVKN